MTAGRPAIIACGQSPVDAFRTELEKEFLATVWMGAPRAAKPRARVIRNVLMLMSTQANEDGLEVTGANNTRSRYR